jgi:hypothetical protein
MSQLQPAAKAADEALAGRRPLPVKSLERAKQALRSQEAHAQPDAGTGAPALNATSAPDSSQSPQKNDFETFRGHDERPGRAAPHKAPSDADSPIRLDQNLASPRSHGVRTDAPQPTTREDEPKPGSAQRPDPEERRIDVSMPLQTAAEESETPYGVRALAGQDLYRESALGKNVSQPDADRPIMPRRSELPAPDEARQERLRIEARRYHVLLAENATVDAEMLVRYLARRLDGAENARAALSEGRGILLRHLSYEDALSVRSELERLGIAVVLAAAEHPAIDREPLEALSVQAKGSVLTFSSPILRVRVAPADIAVLHCCTMKLSPKSPTYKRVIEVVPATDAQRIQLWERTLIAAACVFEPESVATGDQPFMAVFRALCARAPAAALTSAAQRALSAGQRLVTFDSFQAYENYVIYNILMRLGEKLP